MGADNVQKIADNCIEIGVKYLTIYAFSSENWNRPEDEVKYLMDLLYDYLSKESSELMNRGIKIIVSGNLDNVEERLSKKIRQVEELSKKFEVLDSGITTKRPWLSDSSRQFYVKFRKK